MIKHFVGDKVSVSLIIKNEDTPEEETTVRIALETDPDKFLDFDMPAWTEVAMVVMMIDASHKMAAAQPHFIVMPHPPEEGENDTPTT